jgi:hypothetical protein
MKKAALSKIVLVACLTMVGFSQPRPAAAYLNLCSWEYCNNNWNCNCRCTETGPATTCAAERESGCIFEY